MVGCVLRLSIYYFGSYVINIDRLLIYARHMFPTSKNGLIVVITFAFLLFLWLNELGIFTLNLLYFCNLKLHCPPPWFCALSVIYSCDMQSEKLSLLGNCIIFESIELRTIHDKNLLIQCTSHHITTTHRIFLYFMLIYMKTSWSCYKRYQCILPQLPHILQHILWQKCRLSDNIWGLVYDTI